MSASLIGHLPRNPRLLGPVGGVSFRVASRIANTLKAGWPVRSLGEMNDLRRILFYSPAEHMLALAEALIDARIEWTGKSLVFCDCDAGSSLVAHFRTAGASVARLRRCGVAGRLAVEGAAPALTWANGLVRELKRKPVLIAGGSEVLFDAAIMLGSGALTPLLDGAARLLRNCGLRDADAAQMAAGLFARTAAEYAHSGRQSWAWHSQEPDPSELVQQLNLMPADLQSIVKRMLLLGFDTFDRHSAAEEAIQKMTTSVVSEK